MVTLGVSVYPDMESLEDIENYLKLVSSYGFTRVFSSMFSVEDTNENIIAYFTKFIQIAHQYKMEVSLDVNPNFLKRLGVTPQDISLFDTMKCDIIRMDLSYGLEGDIALLNNPYGIKIEFNASTAFSNNVEEYLKRGVKKESILTCHNFYPQPYTAMKWKNFLETNKEIKKLGIRCGAFVSSNAKNTHGVWDAIYGLPTVEKHRHLPIDLQVREMLATGNITDILIGNAWASEEELQSIQTVLRAYDQKLDESNPMVQMMLSMGGSAERFKVKTVMKVTLNEEVTELEKEDLFNFFPHMDVGDSSEWIWRSRSPRFAYNKKGIPARVCPKEKFVPGDIVIINNHYQHYAGEVQIVLREIPNDGLRNYVGSLDAQEMELLELLNNTEVVKFIEKENG